MKCDSTSRLEDAQEGRTSHPPNPVTPRRALSQAKATPMKAEETLSLGYAEDEFERKMKLAACGETNDRPFFSAGPALISVGKREAEQRGLRDSPLLSPGKTAIGSPVDHAPLPYNPSVLWTRKAHSQEVGQLRAGAATG